MKYVLDSCVAFKWVVPETDSDRAIQLRDETRSGLHELVVPGIFGAEVAHALTRAERQNRVSNADGWRLWCAVLTEPLAVEDYTPLMPRAYAIASKARIGVYDCLYVALAERESCELLTADTKLWTNLSSTFPFLVRLETW